MHMFSKLKAPIGILLCFIGLSGCERVDNALDKRESILTERSAIEAYTDAIKTTWKLQDAFVSHVVAGSKARDPAKIGPAYATKAAGSLDAYIDALTDVSIASPRLESLHTPLVTAHKHLRVALATFGTGLTADNYGSRRGALSQAIADFHAAQTVYASGVQSYYAEHGVERLPDPPIRLEPRR
jgi:hypothetical protein